MMEPRRAPRTRFAASFLFFGLTAVMAILLLLMALVVWLSQVTGSLITASLIVGGACGLLALVTYMLVIRDALDRMQEQLDTVYEVASLARTGYEWVTDKLSLLMALRGKEPPCEKE